MLFSTKWQYYSSPITMLFDMLSESKRWGKLNHNLGRIILEMKWLINYLPLPQNLWRSDGHIYYSGWICHSDSTIHHKIQTLFESNNLISGAGNGIKHKQSLCHCKIYSYLLSIDISYDNWIEQPLIFLRTFDTERRVNV